MKRRFLTLSLPTVLCGSFYAKEAIMRRTSKRIFLIGFFALSLVVRAHAGLGQWTTIGPDGGTTLALAIDPLTPATLYAGSSGGGVFKTTNGGASWTAMNSGLTNGTIQALAIDPLTPATLY